MTAAELLALLGRAWSRLVIYPGGLGLLLALLLIRLRDRQPGVPAADWIGEPSLRALTAVAAPWLGLALLPLPLAPSIDRSLDIVTAFALLEWPRLLAAVDELRSGSIARLAAILNSYPPFLAAMLLLALPNGSLEIGGLAQAPGEGAVWPAAAHWAGAIGLIVALAPLLGLGPFTCPPPRDQTLRLGLALRALGIGALATLPWAGLLSEELLWLLPLPALTVAGAIWGLHRFGRGRAALPWARALFWLSAVQIGLLLAIAGLGLAERIR